MVKVADSHTRSWRQWEIYTDRKFEVHAKISVMALTYTVKNEEFLELLELAIYSLVIVTNSCGEFKWVTVTPWQSSRTNKWNSQLVEVLLSPSATLRFTVEPPHV